METVGEPQSEEDLMTWTWRYETITGEAIGPSTLGEAAASEPFPSQSDAESWLGEFWRPLAEAGVAQVTLLEADRLVYGPMGLSAE